MKLIHVASVPSLIGLSTLFSCLGCAAQSTQRSPPTEAPAEEAEGADEALEQGSKEKSSPREEPTPAEESSSEEEAPAGSLSPPDAASEKKRSAGSLLSEQSERKAELTDILEPSQLSCSGAQPIVEAICAIADRICNMEAPSSLNKADCKTARRGCTDAQKKYDKACKD